MSSARAAAMTSSSACGGKAPASAKTMMSSRKIISVGIERMPNCAARSCSSSVLIFANSRSGWRSAAAANTGANERQGPHHGAQKSTRASAAPLIVSAKRSAVNSTTPAGAAAEGAVTASFPDAVDERGGRAVERERDRDEPAAGRQDLGGAGGGRGRV